MASPLLEERRHNLVLRVPRSGLTVNGDITRLSQVVQNLLTNARRPRREYTKCSTRRDVPHVPFDSTPHVTVLDCTGSEPVRTGSTGPPTAAAAASPATAACRSSWLARVEGSSGRLNARATDAVGRLIASNCTEV
jgi:hypothetical protein